MATYLIRLKRLAKPVEARSCRLRVYPAFGLVVLLLGCTTYEAASRDVSQTLESWHRRPVRLDGDGALSVGPASSKPAPGEPADPNASATTMAQSRLASPLHGYIMEALERNPSVKAAMANVQAKLARIPQATSLPDPMLRTLVRPEPIQTAAGDAYFTLGVGQKIPLPAKLDRAGRIAAAEVRMAIEQLNATRLRVISDVERAYYRLYVTDRSIELTATNRELLRDLEKVLASQYRVGKAQQQDLLRVQTERSNLLNDENRFRQQRVSAAAALNQLLDASPLSEVPATEPIRVAVVQAQAEELVELAKKSNPQLAGLAHQTERDRERVALADLGYWPDFDVGFEWTYLKGRDAWIPPRNSQTGMRPPVNRKSEQGDDNWALMFQVNVPIWAQRIEASKREARQNLNKTLHEQKAAANLVAFRIHDARTRVQTRQDTIKLLESTLIPQARQTYGVSLTAYQTGKADFLTVIDNWRRMLTFELMLHREVTELEIAFSGLQREVGVQLIRSKLMPEGKEGEVRP